MVVERWGWCEGWWWKGEGGVRDGGGKVRVV